jgi:hydroxyacylglutathione hydrolase
MVYDDQLAQAAYVIGCDGTGEAVVVDPERDIDRYLELAEREGLRIVASLETHVHADYVSGSRELADQVGAEVIVSGEGGAEWVPAWIEGYKHRVVRDGDEIHVGGVRLEVVHSPGHTPEHVAYMVYDAGSDEAMGILSGDFVFVGDLGRPDLLEKAAGVTGTMELGARALCASARRFVTLRDDLLVWPGHGSGSACGKALGAVQTSTVGYEKRHNAALRASSDEAAFVSHILAGQHEPPAYFGRMKRVNIEGLDVVGGARLPARIGVDGLPTGGDEAVIIDVRGWDEFIAGHVANAISAPSSDRGFATAVGSFVREYQAIYLIGDDAQVLDAVRGLMRVGLDNILGYVPTDAARGGPQESEQEIDVRGLAEVLAAGSVGVLDVRRATEFADGHVPGAQNISHVSLRDRIGEVARDEVVYVICRSGIRSARSVSLLRCAGVRAVNVIGGFEAWREAGGAVEHSA